MIIDIILLSKKFSKNIIFYGSYVVGFIWSVDLVFIYYRVLLEINYYF